jgi:hypothetical protein
MPQTLDELTHAITLSGARPPQPEVVGLGGDGRSDVTPGEHVVGLDRERSRVAVTEELLVDEQAVGKPVHVGEQPAVVVATDDVALEADLGAGPQQGGRVLGGLRAEALGWPALDVDLRRVDPEQAHPFVARPDGDVDRVAVDDSCDNRYTGGRWGWPGAGSD